MTLWIAIGIFWLVSVFFAIALCKSAARADEMLGYKDADPYEVRERAARVERALLRAGVTPIDTRRP